MEIITCHPQNRRWLACNGRTWLPIGVNISFVRSWSDPGEALCRQLSWIDRIADHGGNCARVWLSQPLFDPEPHRAGEFDPLSGERFRALLDRARRRKVRLKLCLEHVRTVQAAAQQEIFPGAARFDKPVWARAAGGPADTLAEYLDGVDGRAHYLRRFEWFARQVGDDGVVWAWELWNEINAVSGGDWRGWTRVMLAEAARRVPQLVVQSFGSMSEDASVALYAEVVPTPGNTMAQVHRYLDPGAELDVVRGPVDLGAADAVGKVTVMVGTDRPVLLSECGAVEAHHAGPSRLYDRDREGTIFHDVLFAPFFAGACGPGQCWHWDHHYIDRHGLWWHLARFAEAIAGIDFATAGLQPERRDSQGLRVYQLASPHLRIAWIRDGASDWCHELQSGISAQPILDARWHPGCSAGWLSEARLTAYDPWSGRLHPLVTDGDAVILPRFTRSLVVRAETVSVNSCLGPE